jgi:iron complex transport system ATP-binding protein
MKSAMKVEQLVLAAQDKILLDSIELDLEAGGIHLILGPNGAGKTLLLRCMAGVLHPTEGRIVLGDPTGPMPLSWTPLSNSLPFAFTVRELVLMGRYPWHQGFPGKSDDAKAQDALRRVSMLDFADRVYNSLSRGEQTRVDIARAIASESRLMLFDEPFANLDIDASLHMTEVFRSLAAEGRTLVLSHHDLYSTRDLATHLVFLKKGKVIAAGPCAALLTPDMIRETYDVEARVYADHTTGDWFIRFQNAPL